MNLETETVKKDSCFQVAAVVTPFTCEMPVGVSYPAACGVGRNDEH